MPEFVLYERIVCYLKGADNVNLGFHPDVKELKSGEFYTFPDWNIFRSEYPLSLTGWILLKVLREFKERKRMVSVVVGQME